MRYIVWTPAFLSLSIAVVRKLLASNEKKQEEYEYIAFCCFYWYKKSFFLKDRWLDGSQPRPILVMSPQSFQTGVSDGNVSFQLFFSDQNQKFFYLEEFLQFSFSKNHCQEINLWHFKFTFHSSLYNMNIAFLFLPRQAFVVLFFPTTVY